MTATPKTIGDRLAELDAEYRRLMDEWWAGMSRAERIDVLKASWRAGEVMRTREGAWKHWSRAELHRAKRRKADGNEQ